ncbi:DUF6644 family protein [Desertibaculum subflavum]|uniref:DUF6644 family protein n=1 Tax=Desertibaculum subflavum TaxID=2268458 RepID=UPI000E673389
MEQEAASAVAWALALERSAFAAAIRASIWIYPAANVLHVLGIALLFGSVAVFDLRLLGVNWAGRPAEAALLALPLARTGLAIALPTGFLLFSTEASAYVVNPIFQAKFAAIVIAFLNLALFHAGSYRRIAGWGGEVPASARLAAGISVLAWLAAVVCGRFAAYV